MENAKDKLDIIFEMQKRFNDEITLKRGLPEYTGEEWLMKISLAMMSEMGELLDELNFKWWKNPKPINEVNIKEELIDILHFFVSMCLRMGMNSEEVFDVYMRKNQENFNRQYGISDKKGYEIEKLK